MERLQKVIANSGISSRRKAEELIKEGRVCVDGKIVNQLGIKVSKNSIITVDGINVSFEPKEYYILNKPRGVVTSVSDEHGRKTVIDLIETEKRIYPVGRLDYDTTGIILLTNDGELTNILTHPKNHIEKDYIVKVNGIVTGNDIKKLKQGIQIDNGFITSPAKVKLKKIDKKNNTSFLEMSIYEGKNHQVKKMIEAIGYKVIKLKRERIAFLTLEGLKSGDYRKLNPKEISKLYSLSIKK